MIKIYECRKCGFKGTRRDVRKHLRKEHLVRGAQRDLTGERKESMLGMETKSEEWGEKDKEK